MYIYYSRTQIWWNITICFTILYADVCISSVHKLYLRIIAHRDASGRVASNPITSHHLLPQRLYKNIKGFDLLYQLSTMIIPSNMSLSFKDVYSLHQFTVSRTVQPSWAWRQSKVPLRFFSIPVPKFETVFFQSPGTNDSSNRQKLLLEAVKCCEPSNALLVILYCILGALGITVLHLQKSWLGGKCQEQRCAKLTFGSVCAL